MSRAKIPAGLLVVAAAVGTIVLGRTVGADPQPDATPAPAAAANAKVNAKAASGQLATLKIAHPGPMAGYSRAQFGHGWKKQHGNACDTREIVLHQQGQQVVSDPKTCEVTTGTWDSLYDGKTVHNPHQLDIDHLVPEAEAWRTGAASWTPEQRQRFSNDYSSELVAVTAHSNRSKGDQAPPGYRPARSEWCRYATGWIAVKHHYRLTVSRTEKAALTDMLGTCARAAR